MSAWPLSFSNAMPKSKLPKGWRWVSLLDDDVAELASGHTPSRKESSYWGGDVPWISLRDVKDLGEIYIHDTADHPTKKGIENSAARMLPKETVVLSRTASLGHCAIMGREMATSQDFANWICGPLLDPLYLLFVFRGSKPVLKKASDGAIHKTIYMPTIKRAKIILPPLDKQRALVKQLSDAWATARAMQVAAASALAAVEALPGALLRAAFPAEETEN
jgi:type I restriction enzyme S subunit